MMTGSFAEPRFLRRLSIFLAALSFYAVAVAAPAYAFSALDFYRTAQGYRAVNAFGATVHCAHETGNWQSRLWTEGMNGAGIKANKAWIALGMPYIETFSGEDIGGKNVAVRSSFRKYSSVDKFLRDYARKVRDDYPVSARYYKNIWGYISGLYLGRNGRWATDRRYFEKLVNKAVQLAPEIYGESWRKMLSAQFENARGFKILADWQEAIVRSALGVR